MFRSLMMVIFSFNDRVSQLNYALLGLFIMVFWRGLRRTVKRVRTF